MAAQGGEQNLSTPDRPQGSRIVLLSLPATPGAGGLAAASSAAGLPLPGPVLPLRKTSLAVEAIATPDST